MKKSKKVMLLGMAAVMVVGVFSSVVHANEEFDAIAYDKMETFLDARTVESSDAVAASGVVRKHIKSLQDMADRLQNVEDSKGLLSRISQTEFMATDILNTALAKKDTAQIIQLTHELDSVTYKLQTEVNHLLRNR
ncbi:hypothetical protein D3C87_104910 [compost metagenome]